MKNSREPTTPVPRRTSRRARGAVLPLVLGFALLALARPVAARPELCETAAAQAAQEVGVPADVLLAIALTETGRRQGDRMRPWPWAANTDGRGHWFDSRDDALAFLRETLANGRRSIDLGCFQINLRWHGQHFATPEALLDPITGARYAARHLSDLHAELGSWEAAAGAYHSRTPSLNSRYRARFAELRANLRGRGPTGLQTALAPPDAAPRPTRQRPSSDGALPLLSGAVLGASLVPVSSAGSAPFILLQP